MHAFNDLVPKFEHFIQTYPIFSSHPLSLYEPCTYALASGGKRVRPILTLMATELFADTIPESAYLAALSFELFHNFTLVHDDIMDNSPVRRGRPSVYKKYGETAAILSGDVMNICAYNILGKIENASQLQQLLRLFNATAIEICEGQQLDMDFEKKSVIAREQYIEMIRLKTSVLLAACLKAGGIIAGADDRDISYLYDFGLYVGLAFQLQDDYLDTFGTELIIGKLPGGDISNNKKTLLYIALQTTMQQANDTAAFENMITLPAASKLSTYKSLLIKYEIEALIKKDIENYSQKAFESLAGISIPAYRKQPLQELVKMLINRKK